MQIQRFQNSYINNYHNTNYNKPSFGTLSIKKEEDWETDDYYEFVTNPAIQEFVREGHNQGKNYTASVFDDKTKTYELAHLPFPHMPIFIKKDEMNKLTLDELLDRERRTTSGYYKDKREQARKILADFNKSLE